MIVQDVLLSGPGAIRETMLEAFKHHEAKEAAAFRAKIRAIQVGTDVAKAAKENGWTNAELREGETRRRLETDGPYNDAMRESDEERAVCARIEAALAYHKNRLRAALALSTATGNLDLEFPEA